MSDDVRPDIPDRKAFKASEVCAIAQLQPYVLRSWELEFPDLGLSKTPGAPRIYRRVDVDRVLRIKQLVFVEGLTLSGARRRLDSETNTPEGASQDSGSDDFLVDDAVRQRLRALRDGLLDLRALLDRRVVTHERFALEAPVVEQDDSASGKRRSASRSRRANAGS